MKRRHLSLLLLVATMLSCGPDNASTGPCTSTDTWASYGHSFMSSNCATCHTAYGSQGTVQAGTGSISSVISSGSMPRGITLTAAERTRAEAWLNCGAP